MKVAIATPTTWPYVRRGGERFSNELARYLGSRGHDVTIISSKPGAKQVTAGEGYVTVCHRRLWHSLMGRIGLLEFHMFFFPCLIHLLTERFDVIVNLTFMDAFAAQLARSFGSGRCFLMLNGIPPRKRYFKVMTLQGAVFGRAIRKADVVVAVSQYVSDYLTERWNRASLALPPPVDTDRFYPCASEKSEFPLILCAASLDDARKGGRILMRAFEQLKRSRPDARLQLVTAVESATKSALLALVSPEWHSDIEFQHAEDELPGYFRRATISVLPSLWEPFGMVVIESMASGTPVVGTRDGALPELISNRGVGRLFDSGEEGDAEPTNVSGLVEAMKECIELAQDPETAVRCRAHAMRYSWERLGPCYESTLLGLSAVHDEEPETVKTP